ncbi:small ribosomal subunit Rsm22 family protein [Nonomuraea sp. M3C6]|uniref:Small ribosomal subunit Rsm22 family protein n=1 Tax=Nonomuraea marmarensis TaxID=3351344 RepID=A0ABW7A6V4_9ACTN
MSGGSRGSAPTGPGTAAPAPRVTSRILRHPHQRKGLVSLRLCTAENGVRDVIVSKRQGELYRLARDAEWGDGRPRTD